MAEGDLAARLPFPGQDGGLHMNLRRSIVIGGAPDGRTLWLTSTVRRAPSRKLVRHGIGCALGNLAWQADSYAFSNGYIALGGFLAM